MTLKPPSQRPEFSGVSAFYDETLVPYLRNKEEERTKAIMNAGIVAFVGVVIGAAVWAMFGIAELGGVIGVVGFVIAGGIISKARSNISDGLFARIIENLGFRYQHKISRPEFCSDFRRLKLIKNFNKEHWEDLIAGQRSGVDFSMCEAKLQHESGSGKNRKVTTIFFGQFFVIDYHKEFLGETVVKRDAGLLNRFGKPSANFQRVGIASPKFEKIFEAWSTDQVEARDLLDPIVLERFEALDDLFDGAKIRAAFSNGKLFIALENGDKLNMGSMFKALESADRVETIYKEIDLLFDLIDLAVKRIEGRASGAINADLLKAN